MRHLILVAILALLTYLLTGIAQVRPGEQVVVRRFGRVVATPGPGLWVGLPWGFETIDRVAVDRVRRVTIGYLPEVDEAVVEAPPGQLLTGDQNLVDVQMVIDYAVRPDAVVEYAAIRDRADGAIARAAEAALAEWVAGRSVDDVLVTGKSVLPAWLTARLRERLEVYRLGIDVQAAGVTHLAPPEQVRAAFNDVTRAQAAIRTREQEANQEAERLRQQAETKVFQWTQSAAAAAHEQLTRAKADGAGFQQRLAQYQRSRRTNPDVLTALWWEEMGPLLTRLRVAGRLDVLDAYLGAEGLDIMQVGPRPKPK